MLQRWLGESGILVELHLVWPGGQAWCLACEVDEEIEFNVGCSHLVAHALGDAFAGKIRHTK